MAEIFRPVSVINKEVVSLWVQETYITERMILAIMYDKIEQVYQPFPITDIGDYIQLMKDTEGYEVYQVWNARNHSPIKDWSIESIKAKFGSNAK